METISKKFRFWFLIQLHMMSENPSFTLSSVNIEADEEMEKYLANRVVLVQGGHYAPATHERREEHNSYWTYRMTPLWTELTSGYLCGRAEIDQDSCSLLELRLS
uniref:Uncharacterized protein n=1 Tax=Utricularia reniformis TaxID=192314 RepID=A0A1Y0B1L7_9LAMI|nr:hypothetical protein AEK19_MT1059 [Utricularia reniformis]ART31281.1 hypothetical protein AEK19_MT1059 [Utricularia reniformis]